MIVVYMKNGDQLTFCDVETFEYDEKMFSFVIKSKKLKILFQETKFLDFISLWKKTKN